MPTLNSLGPKRASLQKYSTNVAPMRGAYCDTRQLLFHLYSTPRLPEHYLASLVLPVGSIVMTNAHSTEDRWTSL
jgi:hypothetical protein